MLAMNAQNIKKIKSNQEMLCVSYVVAVAVGRHGPILPGSLRISLFLCVCSSFSLPCTFLQV